MSDFFELIEQTKTASPKDRRAALLPEANNANISRLVLRLQGRGDARTYLRALCDLSSAEKARNIIARNVQIYENLFRAQFRSEDPKTRKLVCELAGNVAPDLFLDDLAEALKKEPTDFVRPSILLAIGNAQEKREEARGIVNAYVIPPCDEKHAEEQRLALKKAKSSMEGVKISLEEDKTDIPCEKCGSLMVVKVGRFGKFFACPNYPDCKFTKPFVQETGGSCPRCGSTVISKKSRKGHTFFGCSGYPECDFMTWDTPTKDACPDCGKTLFRSRGNVVKCLSDGCGYEKRASRKADKDED